MKSDRIAILKDLVKFYFPLGYKPLFDWTTIIAFFKYDTYTFSD